MRVESWCERVESGELRVESVSGELMYERMWKVMCESGVRVKS